MIPMVQLSVFGELTQLGLKNAGRARNLGLNNAAGLCRQRGCLLVCARRNCVQGAGRRAQRPVSIAQLSTNLKGYHSSTDSSSGARGATGRGVSWGTAHPTPLSHRRDAVHSQTESSGSCWDTWGQEDASFAGMLLCRRRHHTGITQEDAAVPSPAPPSSYEGRCPCCWHRHM